MKKLLTVSIIIAVMVAIGTSLVMAADTPQQKEIKAYFVQLAAMYGNKDTAGEMKVFEPRATMKFSDGRKITIEQWAAETKKEVAAYKTIKCSIVPDKIVVRGDKATVDFTETDIYTMEVKGKTIGSTVVSGWTVKMKRSKDGWKIYDFVEHYEKNTPKK